MSKRQIERLSDYQEKKNRNHERNLQAVALTLLQCNDLNFQASNSILN